MQVMGNKEKLEKVIQNDYSTLKKKVALERCVWEQKEGEGGRNSLSLELKRMAFDAS